MDKKTLGIEFGSTRVKAILLKGLDVIASSNFEWENQFVDGFWTYDINLVWEALASVYEGLKADYKNKTGEDLKDIDSIGISGMMHGYLAFDKDGNLLAPFRTWRNTNTDEAVEILTEKFQFNIPHRWSIAHLYQALLNKEDHINEVAYFTTLAGYVHWKLTGEKVLGVGDASGMFPIAADGKTYDQGMIETFDELVKDQVDWKLGDILPELRLAGEDSGRLTEEGKKLLDKSFSLENFPIMCPPEGDAGTGMVSTNSIHPNTGNVSAGTSIFLMVVLDKALKNYYREIDMVTTPSGMHTAMIHCNNFTSDINNWAGVFEEVVQSLGFEVDKGLLFQKIFEKALEADEDIGKLVSCNFHAGEPIVKMIEGRPLLIQQPDSVLNLANFMKSQIYAAIATLRLGTDILIEEEGLTVKYILGHGGFFKTKNVGQVLMANALNIPISVLENAGEGGAWGIAVLAQYMFYKDELTLEEYLSKIVFKDLEKNIYTATEEGVNDYNKYLERFKAMLKVEEAAVKYL